MFRLGLTKYHSIQRRIRHIRSIAGRNIVWKEVNSEDMSTLTHLQPSNASMKRSDSSTSLGTTSVEDSSLMKRAYKKYEKQQQHLYSVGLLDAYFTLHTGHLNEPEFYKSEMISNTINPTFRALAFPYDWMNWYDAASSLLVIRVWVRHAIPESAGLHSEPVLGYQEHNKQVKDEGFELLIEWQMDLNALAWIGKKVDMMQRSTCLFFL